MSDYAVMPINDYVETCDTIRAKTGEISVIKSGELASKVNEVYEAGKKAEYDTFWDTYQNKNGGQYGYAFYGNGWRKEIFRPKHDMYPTSAGYMFAYQNDPQIVPYDLVEHLADLGVTLSFENCTNVTNIFNYNYSFSRIGVMDCSKVTSLSNCFNNCKNLITIDKLIFPTGTGSYTGAFNFANSLKNLTVEGEIKNDLSVKYSPLTVESMNSIISCLKDYSGTTSTHTLTLKADRQNMLTDVEKAVATSKGWTLVWS